MTVEVLDGHNTIGGNKILVLDNKNEGFLLDFGLNFAYWYRFFEELVKPRTGRILSDLLRLKLIPELDIYRDDLNPPNFGRSLTLRFLFVSHAHADHCGMTGLVKPNIPLLMTNETLAIMKASSEIRAETISELYQRRRVKPEEGSLIRSDLMVVANKKADKFQKRMLCALDLKDDMRKSLEEKFDLVDRKDLWSDELFVQRVYHSVIGSAGLLVKIDGIWLAYTGDFRMGPKSKAEEDFWLEHLGANRLELAKRTESFLQLLSGKKPLILITEGTRVGRQSDAETTEKDVYEKVLHLVEVTNKLVIADFPVRHLERLLTFLNVAKKTDRYLVLMPKDYAYLVTMEQIEPVWKLSDEERSQLKVYHVAKSQFDALEKEVLQRAMDENIIIQPHSIDLAPDKYIFCAGYWEIPNLLDLDVKTLERSVYIHSTSEAYTEEQEIDFKRLGNWLKEFSIQPYGIRFTETGMEFTKDFHASGHVSATDLEMLIEEISPDFILPIHTEGKDWFIKRWGYQRVILSSLWYT